MANGAPPRYGVTCEDISTVEDRNYWFAGSSPKVLHLLANEVIAERGNQLNNVLLGNSGANQLEGRDGDDLLNGGAGRDTMYGEQGNDTYVVDNSGDRVIENYDEGKDLVQSSITYTLGD